LAKAEPEKKADHALANKLATALPDEELTVILELVGEHEMGSGQVDAESVPAAEAVERAKQEAFESNRGVIDSLVNLGLTPRGGRYAPVVVVTGSAEQVREALALEGVSGAALDVSIELIKPERPKDKK
jgi:hypothetical protein